MTIVAISRNLCAEERWCLDFAGRSFILFILRIFLFFLRAFLWPLSATNLSRPRRIPRFASIALCASLCIDTEITNLVNRLLYLQEAHPQLPQDEACPVFGALRDQGEDRWVIFSLQPEQRELLLLLSRAAPRRAARIIKLYARMTRLFRTALTDEWNF